MDKKTKFIFFNVLGCIAFLIIPLFLFPRPPEETSFIFSKPTQRDFIGNIIMLVFFYLNYYWLIPHYYFQKKYVIYIFFIVVGLFVVVLLPSVITGHNLNPNSAPPNFHPNNNLSNLGKRPTDTVFLEEVRHHIFLFLSVILFPILLRIRDRLILSERAKHEAEISFLKAQINPHFLFNTLNSIYALAINKDDATPDAIVQLSEMMRYVIRDANNETVSLEKEIEYIDNYIALQKQRLGNTVIIEYLFEGETIGKQIIPLILIPFIENAFKHGVNPDGNSLIKINIFIKENDLHLIVINNKVSIKSNLEGIGLQNSKERLQIAYPSKHKLLIADLAKTFTIDLLITL